MAISPNATKLTHLIDPEVLAPMIEQKMFDALKLTPLARVDTTLQGQPGSTVKLPKFTFIGAAEAVGEGQPIPIKQLTSTTKEVTISKVGNGVELTDESVLSGYGDPIGQAAKQIGESIALKADNDLLTTLNGIGAAMTETLTTPLTTDGIAKALVRFGEDLDGNKVLLIAPEQLAQLRISEDWIKATDVGVQMLMSGSVGMIHGCQVVISNKIKKAATAYTNFIVKPEALALFLKRDTMVETDRDIINKTTVITADKHYATYLYDDTKAIKIVTKEA